MEEMHNCFDQVGITVRISSEHMKWSNCTLQVNLWSWMSPKHNTLYWKTEKHTSVYIKLKSHFPEAMPWDKMVSVQLFSIFWRLLQFYFSCFDYMWMFLMLSHKMNPQLLLCLKFVLSTLSLSFTVNNKDTIYRAITLKAPWDKMSVTWYCVACRFR